MSESGPSRREHEDIDAIIAGLANGGSARPDQNMFARLPSRSDNQLADLG